MRHSPRLAVLLVVSLSPWAVAVGQIPADTLSTHPASSAHATATAGQANAMRIESCVSATDALVDNLQHGNYQAATTDFDAKMHANLDAAKLAQVWRQVTGQTGVLQTRGRALNALYQGRVIITLPLHFQKASLNAQVACDTDGRIGGFFLRPASPSASG